MHRTTAMATWWARRMAPTGLWLAALALALFPACVDRKAVPDSDRADAETAEAGVEDSGIPWSDGALPPLPSTCPSQRGMVGIPFPDGAC